jgi:glycosyltransferase involved in cell wall biosynthesis
MKIAHLVIGGEVAGGQMVALDLARAARARDDEVLFLSPSRGAFTELVEGEGIRAVGVDVSRAFRIGGAWKLARALRRNRADVLHTHTAIAANVLSRVAGRLAKVPVVSHLHIENYLPPNPARAAALRALDNASARLAARIVAVSEGTKRALVEQGYPQGLIEVVPNGVQLVTNSDNEAGRRALSALGLPAGAPVVGEIARLCDVKGQRELIQAVARLPGVHAVLAGEDLETGGAFRRSLEQEARELGVADRIVFAGYRPAAEILPALDLLVLPSWIEGMPIVVLEAMAHGKAVVATPVGGTPEVVVDGETGLLVPPRDPARLAAAIGRILADRDLARDLGEAGRNRVAQRFSAEAMAGRVLEIYDEVARP